jgi:hypothetical protein
MLGFLNATLHSVFLFGTNKKESIKCKKLLQQNYCGENPIRTREALGNDIKILNRDLRVELRGTLLLVTGTTSHMKL